MPPAPLQPFSPPSGVLGFAPVAISQAFVIEWFCYAILVFWAAYTAVAAYHWLKYSHGSLIAIPAIITHLGVSFIIITYMLSGALVL